ncbi:MAG: hypothetical protein FJ246_08175 [Nitrospira sp.]|nr:hypothetical protein [Nitrospira sp.]
MRSRSRRPCHPLDHRLRARACPGHPRDWPRRACRDVFQADRVFSGRAFSLLRSWIRRFLEIGGNRRRPTRPGVARPGLTLAVAAAASVAAAVGAHRALAVSGRAVFLDGGVTIQFIWLPAGRFLSGSPADESGRESDETQHPVKLTRGFYMQTTEVTQAQWQALMGNNPSNFRGNSTKPVEQVSWWDAVAYANALSAAEGLSPAYSLSNCVGATPRGAPCAAPRW